MGAGLCWEFADCERWGGKEPSGVRHCCGLILRRTSVCLERTASVALRNGWKILCLTPSRRKPGVRHSTNRLVDFRLYAVSLVSAPQGKPT